jgi:hypothetical protein
MKPAAKRVFTLLALPAIAFVLGGCVGFPVSGYGEMPVYGGYGYVGPWDSGRQVEVEGGYFVPPPYGRSDRGRRVEVEEGYFAAPPYGRSDRGRRGEYSRRREEAAPERRAPVQRTAPHPIPSIPSNPRPARQSRDKNQR